MSGARLGLAILAIMVAASAASCRKPAPVAQIDCDPLAGPCAKAAAPIGNILFHVSPVPVLSMRELVFSVTVPDSASVQEVELDFSMPGMFMGPNRITLKPIGAGLYNGVGVLPRCPTGGRIWRAEALLKLKGGGERSASYVFEVSR